MKGGIRAIVILLSITGLIGSVATYKVASIISVHLNQQICSYAIDDRILPQKQHEIISFLEDSSEQSIQKKLTSLCQTFSMIDSAQAAYFPETVEYALHARDLIACVNNQCGITRDGNIVDMDGYTTEYKKTLDKFFIADESIVLTNNALPSSVYTWLCLTPKAFFQQFIVTWHNAHDVQLQCNEKKTLVLRCTAEQLRDQHMLAYCEKIASQLTTNENVKIAQSCIADIRFDKQVIVSKRQKRVG